MFCYPIILKAFLAVYGLNVLLYHDYPKVEIYG